MSQNKDKDVLKLIESFVEKERNEKPALEMKEIRKLVLGDLALKNIRIETNSSAYRKLSRCLKNSFKNSIPHQNYITIDGKEPQWLEKGITQYPSKEAQIEGAIRSMTQKGFKYYGKGTWIKEKKKEGDKHE